MERSNSVNVADVREQTTVRSQSPNAQHIPATPTPSATAADIKAPDVATAPVNAPAAGIVAPDPVSSTSNSPATGIVLPPTGMVVPPPSSAPIITPAAAALPGESTADRVQGDYQVRIVATIGTTPIYEREVREAVYQRLPEFMNLSAQERKAKEQSMFKEELRKIIERELILDELFAMLSNKKQSAALTQLKDGAAKDAEHRVREIQKRAGLRDDDDLKGFLRSQGLTLSGIRRHFERSFMVSMFLAERLKPKMNGIGIADVREYYAEHIADFMTDDRVKWQDLFIRADSAGNRADAHQKAVLLMNRVQQGEDFVKLVNEFDQGVSKSCGGVGFGEEKGKINPPELELTVFGLKQGQVGIVEFENGFHIVRVAERTYAGKKPFDEQVQSDIRRKLQGQISDREYRKIVDTMWRKSQPQILVD